MFEKAEFPETSDSMIRDLATGSDQRLDEFLELYAEPMRGYLRSMGINWNDSDESVSNFLNKIVKNRRVFQLSGGSVRFHRRLRTALLNHFLDIFRKRSSEQKKLRRYGEHRTAESEIVERQDPLEFSWAFSVLELAVEVYREQKMHSGQIDWNHLEEHSDGIEIPGNAVEPSHNGHNGVATSSGLPVPEEQAASEVVEEASRERILRDQIDWQIFVLRYIGNPAAELTPHELSLSEIAKMLGLPLSTMKDRCVRIRRDFYRCLRQVVQDTVNDESFQERWNDFQFCLILGNSQCVNLSEVLPEFLTEPPIESVTEFSIMSLTQMHSSSLEKLVIAPEEELNESELGRLWQRMLDSRFYSGESISGGPEVVKTSEFTLQDALFADPPTREDLDRIKLLAKMRGKESCSVLHKLHHALYVLTIALARNHYGVKISTFKVEKIIDTFQLALRYEEWLDDESLRQIEKALRSFM